MESKVNIYSKNGYDIYNVQGNNAVAAAGNKVEVGHRKLMG